MEEKELAAMLIGRQLLVDELSCSQMELEEYRQKGWIAFEPSVRRIANGYQCIRCGNQEEMYFAALQCARCGKCCTYCRRCIMMGRASECTPLIRWIDPELNKEKQQVELAWNGTLSAGQRTASAMLVQAVERKENCLIWAVCGAGKTEMLFAGIQASLQQGERVCVATPRTDVVLELEPRLKQVFPTIPIAALYGGSPDRLTQAPLTIATTHQLLRYFRAFDTVIIDEVDAFPYSTDKTLQYAVQHAKKEQAAVIFVTATPSQDLQKEVKAGRQRAVIIPARYHRHPLPVPSFSWCGSWKNQLNRHRLPTPVLRWVEEQLLAKRPVFLFVPHIRHVEAATALLKRLDARITGVHAEDPKRKEKVRAFRSGQIPLLVTTTILERGVTVANLQVAVLGAEENIFTESALVQIAGRVGRNASYPAGEIVYFHFGKTEAMLAAKRHIEGMNREAKRRGLLH